MVIKKLKILRIITITVLFNVTTVYAQHNFCGFNQPHSIDIWLTKAESVADTKDTNVIEFTRDIINLQYEYYERWDKELNKAYKSLMSKLGANNKILLRNSQRAWLEFFEKEIKLISSFYHDKGQIGQLEIVSTRSQFIRDRTCQLLNIKQ